MLLILTSFAGLKGWGQTTFTWNFGTSAGVASPSSGSLANLTVGDVSIGNSLGSVATWLTTTSPSSGYTGSSAQFNAGNAAKTGVLVTGASGSAYFEFTLTPAATYSISLSSISFGTRSTGTAPQAYTLRSSADSYATDIATGTIANTSTWALKTNSGLTFSGSSGSAITFRLYGYNGAGSPGSGTINWRIDDLSIIVNVTSGGGGSTPPALTADATNNDVDHNIDITFPDDATWRGFITAVKIGGSSLTPTTDYVISSGNIQLLPSGLNPLLTISGTKNVVVTATGYTEAAVSQVINPGTDAKLGMKTQPAAPATSGGALGTQPAVYIQDQYGNNNTSTASVVATVGAGGWTIGGTTSVPAVSGTTTFTDLTATGPGITGATITFTSGALTPVTSAAFNIPCSAAGFPFVEDFNYTAAQLLTAHCWTAHSGSGTNPITVAATSITYPGYLSSGVGNDITMTTTGEDDNRQFTTQTTGVVYASFLVNVTTAGSGDYFFHLAPSTIGSSFKGKVFIKLNGSDINFGIAHSGTAVYSSTPYSTGTTYLIVLKYTFNTGSATDDVAAIYINPPLNDVEPASGWLINTDTPADPADIGTVALRQGSTGTSSSLKIDGIRISNTWSDIVGLPLAEPTNHATSFTATTVTPSTISLTWTDAVGGQLPQNYLLKAAISPAVPAPPTDGIPEADAPFVQNIAYGIQTATFYSLDRGTTYNFAIWPYTNTGAAIDYKLGSQPTATATTSTGVYRSVGTGSWSTLTTWEYSADGSTGWATPSTEPGPTDDVIISNPWYVYIDGSSKTCRELTINPSGGLSVYPGGSLTVSGTVTNSSSAALFISSGPTGTGSLITNNSCPITIDRYMTGSTTAWHLISPPVSGQSINGLVTDVSNEIAYIAPKYGLAPYVNSVPAWKHYNTVSLDPYNAASSGSLTICKGYEVLRNTDGSVRYTGNIVSSGQAIVLTVPASPGTAWNLVGNPFTSPINAANIGTNFLAVNDAVFDPSNKALYVWNGLTYTPINNTSGAQYIALGQAFFMKAKTDGDYAQFTLDMRTHTPTAFYKNSETTWPKISLKADIAGKARNTDVFFIDGTTAGLDPGYDAGMFDGTGSDNSIYTRMDGSNVGFAIQSLPNSPDKDVTIAVGLNSAAGATVKFTAETLNIPAGVKVFIHDVTAGTYTRLDTPGSSYQVTLTSASSGTGRFYITTSRNALGTGDQPKEELYTVIPLPSENKIRLTGSFVKGSQVTICSMSGQVLYTGKLENNNENEIRFAPAVSGIYLLRLQSGTMVVNRKMNWVY